MSGAVRLSAQELTEQFGCSRRLATRIGALMARQVGVSALVLEESASLPALRELLLERTLLEAADPAAELQRLLSLPAYEAMGAQLPLTTAADGDWQVICAEEEALAEGGFAALQRPTPSPEQTTSTASAPATGHANRAAPLATTSAPHAAGMPPAQSTAAHTQQAEGARAAAGAAGQNDGARPFADNSTAGDGGIFAPAVTVRAQTPGSGYALTQAVALGGADGGLAEAFSRQEIARLRVDIFAGGDSARKVSALRQFAYTDVPAAGKAQVFRQALADEDRQLRQAAVAGLRQFGSDVAWSECLRLYAEGVELEVALERLRELTERTAQARRQTPDAQAAEVEAGLLLLAGCLRDRGASAELARAALDGLAAVVPLLPAGFAGWADLAGLLQERLLSGQLELLPGCRAVFRELEILAGGALSQRLEQEAEGSRSPEYAGLLLDLLCGMDLPAEQRARLLPLAVRTLCKLPLEHASARFLRKALSDEADAGLLLLAQELPECDVAHQRSFLRLADNLLCSYAVNEATRNAIARTALQLLRAAPLQLRTDLIETHVIIRTDIDPALRREAALVLLSGLRDYAQWPLCDYLENALAGLGRPAVEPLLAGVREQKNSVAGAILARALGRIGVALSGQEEDIADAILRELSRLSFSDNQIMDALHIAMGQLAARAGVSQEVNALVMRTLLSRLSGTPADAALLRALGCCAAGNIAPDCELPAIIALCLRHLETEQAAPSLQTQMRGGEEVITFGEEVGIYSDLIPAGLAALEQIVLGRRVPADTREQLLQKLLALWESSGALRVQWGLANATQLTEILGRIGESPLVSDRQRVMLAAGLRKRAGSLPVLTALARIVSVPNRLPQLDKMAAALAVKALERLAQPEAGEEDREAYLRLLLKVCARGRFEVSRGTVERLWERIAQAVIECLHQGVGGAAEAARELAQQESLPAAARETLQAVLARLYALTPNDSSATN